MFKFIGKVLYNLHGFLVLAACSPDALGAHGMRAHQWHTVSRGQKWVGKKRRIRKLKTAIDALRMLLRCWQRWLQENTCPYLPNSNWNGNVKCSLFSINKSPVETQIQLCHLSRLLLLSLRFLVTMLLAGCWLQQIYGAAMVNHVLELNMVLSLLQKGLSLCKDSERQKLLEQQRIYEEWKSIP